MNLKLGLALLGSITVILHASAAGVATNNAVSGTNFWSFQPLRSISRSGPAADSASARSTPIDDFIRDKWSAQQLHGNERASKAVLIRRASLDLIGLPPTPEEIAAFENDSAPDAFERCIDRLLASPHYGERWGRHWLDLARFGESHGFEHDTDRPNAYHYRDFVIQALNQDMPFDQFVSWQIAGDELAPESLLAWKATGYLAAGTHATQITANQAEKERYDELDDIVSTIGTSVLGLSLGCARCHDHKYDPIPSVDYYRMLSIFTRTVRSDYELPVDPQKDALALKAYEAEHKPLVAELARYETQSLPAKLKKWEGEGRLPGAPTWLILDQVEAVSKGGATFVAQPDGSFLVTGKNTDFDRFTFKVKSPLDTLGSIRLEPMADPSLPHKGPGRADNGNFDLTDLKLAVVREGTTNIVTVPFAKAVASFEQKGLPVAAAIDSDPKSGWAVDPQFGTHHAARFELATPLTNLSGATLILTLSFDGNNRHAIGRPRLSASAQSDASLSAPDDTMLVAEATRILRVAPAARSAADQATLLRWFRTQDVGYLERQAKIVAHESIKPTPAKMKVLVSSEGLPPVRLNTQGPDFYEKTFVLKRGDLAQKQSEAEPGFLKVLLKSPEGEKHWRREMPKETRTSGQRGALARWLVDVDQGAGALAARVMANRLWQHHFGQGIVGTPSDFGKQGALPSHPELLDWLASQLVQGGWRLKPMHKLIMLSSAYQQRSDTDEDRMSRDAANRWLWHFPRQRLDAEVIRDSMLAVSGRLDPRPFGPGSLDEAMTRRSIYFTVKRSQLIPMMVQFDAPDGLQGVGRRVNTTVAPQGLLLMNHPEVRRSAAAFAGRLQKQSDSLRAQIDLAFRSALGRSPSSEELLVSMEFVQNQASSYEGETRASRALGDFCQTLFGLNDFLYVE